MLVFSQTDVIPHFRTRHFGPCNFESKKQPQKWCNVLERGLETSVSTDRERPLQITWTIVSADID